MKNYKVQSAFLTKDENENYNNKLNIYRNECGCDMGSYFLISSLAFCIISSVIKFSIFASSIYFQFLYSVCTIIIASFFGKAIGLILARVKFSFTVREINSLIKQREDGKLKNYQANMLR